MYKLINTVNNEVSALARLAVYEYLLIRQEISVHCLHLRVLVLCSFQRISIPVGGHFSFRLPTPCNFHSRRYLSAPPPLPHRTHPLEFL